MVGCHGCRGHDGQSQPLCTVAVPASHDERVYEGQRSEHVFTRHDDLFLNVETLQATEDRPFHLALYLESMAHETFDSAAWKRYVHLLQVRARRQKAEGAFYGSLRAEPVVSTPAPPVWRRRQRKEAGKYTIEGTTESTGYGHVPKDHSNCPASTEYRSDSGSSCERGGSSC